MDARKTAESIFLGAVESVHPGKLISGYVKLKDFVLNIAGEEISTDNYNSIYLIGAGKASGTMAKAVEDILCGRVSGGVVIVKYGHSVNLKSSTIIEAGHPIPDENSFKATGEILKIAEKATEKDLVISLLSGGGSSLLADCPAGLAPSDIVEINNLLLLCGADISEINTVRKHLSGVKGGWLASVVYPATLINLMLSDVPGDSPDTIASGPFSPDPSTFSDAIRIIMRYSLEKKMPDRAMNYLMHGNEGAIPETPKPGDKIFSKVRNIIIGSNKTAVDAGARIAYAAGLRSVFLRYNLHGDTEEAAERITVEAIKIRNDQSVAKPACIIYGGETTVRVNGNGTGGRNQHFALQSAVRLIGQEGITILAGGTDGTDGPTDAAGALVDYGTLMKASALGMSAEKYLGGFDSFNFFREAGGHIITGPTFTNVMDLVIVILEN
jgi:glycerate 2-kinase